MRLAARIAKLERHPALRPPPEPCPECGHCEGAEVTYRFTLVDAGQPSRSEWCSTCGRQTVHGIEYDRKG